MTLFGVLALYGGYGLAWSSTSGQSESALNFLERLDFVLRE